MINYGLSKEIYGMNPWFIDQESLPSLLSLLNSFQNGAQIELPEIKYNTPSLLKINSDTRIIDRPFGDEWYPGQLDNKENFTGIGIINIDGPITVSGGMSSVGMRQLSEHMDKMNSDSRIVAFIVYADSGGGSSGAVEIMADTIKKINKEKPVYGLIKKGGIACSAMYGILSACKKIYSESEMSLVGSCGTMISFEGKKANSTDQDGFKYVRLYATKSTEKNKGYEEALNNDNYEVIINDLLNPTNEKFLNMILTNRPKLEGSDFDNGNTKFAKDSIGTYIDGLKSFEEVVQTITDSQIKQLTNINNNKMDNQTLKQEHPKVYQSIFNAGVEAEKSRVGAWLAHADSDLEAVKIGIKSGKELDATSREELLIKGASLSHVKNLEKDSAKPITTNESGSEEKEDTEEISFYANIDEKLKLK